MTSKAGLLPEQEESKGESININDNIAY